MPEISDALYWVVASVIGLVIWVVRLFVALANKREAEVVQETLKEQRATLQVLEKQRAEELTAILAERVAGGEEHVGSKDARRESDSDSLIDFILAVLFLFVVGVAIYAFYTFTNKSEPLTYQSVDKYLFDSHVKHGVLSNVASKQKLVFLADGNYYLFDEQGESEGRWYWTHDDTVCFAGSLTCLALYLRSDQRVVKAEQLRTDNSVEHESHWRFEE